MDQHMKFGLMLPPFYPSALLEMSIDGGHAVGADSFWTFDHFLGLFHPDLWAEIELSELVPDPDGLFDPFCLCAWAARRTELPLGVAVTDSIRRGAPDAARATLTLQHLCPGGFNLGVGCGEAENLLPFGYPFDHPVARTDSFLATLRHLLDTGRIGEGVGRLGIPLRSTAGQPRIWVAAHRPHMLQLTGRYADGWLPVEAGSPEEYCARKATVAEHAAVAERAEPESGLVVMFVLGESRERLRQMFEAKPLAKLFAQFMAPAPEWAKHGLPSLVDNGSRGYIDNIPHAFDPDTLRQLAPRIPFELLEKYLFVGNPTEIAERLRGYADVGLEHVVLLNFTGLVGGVDEAMARAADLAELGRLVKGLAASVRAGSRFRSGARHPDEVKEASREERALLGHPDRVAPSGDTELPVDGSDVLFAVLTATVSSSAISPPLSRVGGARARRAPARSTVPESPSARYGAPA
jgi:phthiodiolone/phenolphthiodiolone dimycocerosates ketoreductase